MRLEDRGQDELNGAGLKYAIGRTFNGNFVLFSFGQLCLTVYLNPHLLKQANKIWTGFP